MDPVEPVAGAEEAQSPVAAEAPLERLERVVVAVAIAHQHLDPLAGHRVDVGGDHVQEAPRAEERNADRDAGRPGIGWLHAHRGPEKKVAPHAGRHLERSGGRRSAPAARR